MTEPYGVVPHYGTCTDCGKLRFPTRKLARKAAKRLHPGDHLRAYRCGRYWHIGHNPALVVQRGIEMQPRRNHHRGGESKDD